MSTIGTSSTRGSQEASPSRGTRTQAERRAASERRLLKVTAELIAQRGTSTVGFGEIAKAAGVSHGLPSYLFGTKAGLLQALLNDFLRRFRAETLEPALRHATGLQALLITARVFLEGLERPWTATRAIYVLQGEALGSSAELQAALADYDATLRSMAEAWIVEGIADGDIRPSVKPETGAALMLGALRGVGHQYITDPFAFDLGALTVGVLDALARSLAVEPDKWVTCGH